MTYAQYKRHASERGIALVTAIVAALVISLSAVVILNMTFRRFELSSQRRDRSISLAGIEGATRYIFQRCDVDPNWREDNIRAGIVANRDAPGGPRNNSCYVLSPLPTDPNPVEDDVIIRYNGVDTGFDISEQIPEFDYNRTDAGGAVRFRKQVHVAIDFEPDPTGLIPDADRRFRLHASTTFGEGN